MTRSLPGLSGSTTRMAVAALTSRRWISLDSISCHGKAVLKVKRVTRALYSHFSPMTDEETTTRAEVFFFLLENLCWDRFHLLFWRLWFNATSFQSFFKQFEKNPDGSVSQEQFMKALKNEKNLIDLLTQWKMLALPRLLAKTDQTMPSVKKSSNSGMHQLHHIAIALISPPVAWPGILCFDKVQNILFRQILWHICFPYSSARSPDDWHRACSDFQMSRCRCSLHHYITLREFEIIQNNALKFPLVTCSGLLCFEYFQKNLNREE